MRLNVTGTTHKAELLPGYSDPQPSAKQMPHDTNSTANKSHRREPFYCPAVHSGSVGIQAKEASSTDVKKNNVILQGNLFSVVGYKIN